MGRTPLRLWRRSVGWPGLVLACVAGCAGPAVRSEPTEAAPKAAPEKPVRLVHDMAHPVGLNYALAEGVGLVTQLAGTGSDPPPSAERSVLIGEMQSHEVKAPERVLASPSTSLVLVRAILPPGVQKGDRIDIEVAVPARSETTSLRGGWLMLTRLRDLAVMDNQLRAGHVRCLAQGAVLIESMLQGGDDPVLETRGRVLGGGVAAMSRPLGLALRGDSQSVRVSSMIGAAINTRFHTYDRGVKRGVATPKRDNFVELAVPARYQHNLARYVRVVQCVPVGAGSAERTAWLTQLHREVQVPASAARASLQLEALGAEAVPALKHALASANPEVRFYAAEALAYLDDLAACEPLGEAALSESAFRWHALTALSAMNDLKAHDVLSELLNTDSAETRYGAFRALQAMNPHDPLIRGEDVSGEFRYHEVATSGQPLVHVARTRVPEIVAFGSRLQLQQPVIAFAGKTIMIKGEHGDRLRISRFATGQDDVHETCSTHLADLIRTLASMGATYPDVVQALQQAREQNSLTARLEFDALPRPGRTYHRGGDSAAAEPSPGFASGETANPLPELFATPEVSSRTATGIPAPPGKPGAAADGGTEPAEPAREAASLVQ